MMDFDLSKENIRPLASGRNVKYLELALSGDAHSHHEELARQRREFEEAIHNYEGDDPLQPWYDYIAWIEQSYPSGGKESGLEDVLLKCMSVFESDQRYMQDRRMIKLYIKYIDTQPHPTEYYQELYNLGIGTMVADLYICWAYHYDINGNFEKAESVFRKGLDAKAQPFDVLDQAHKHFGFTMSQRILHKNEEKYEQEFLESMRERRFALTSLKSHRKKVGSIRTGAAIKSHAPGRLQVDSSMKNSLIAGVDSGNSNSNIAVQVFEDQNRNPNVTTAPAVAPVTTEEPVEGSRSQSLIRSIIDSARKQENMIEPGPWSKHKLGSQKKINFGSVQGPSTSSCHSLKFEILEDDNAASNFPGKCGHLPPIPLPDELNNCKKGIKLPKDFVTRNKPQKEWKVPVTLETHVTGRVLPMYPKFYLYPKPNQEYSLEEYFGYKWCKKNGIENTLTKRLDPIWSNEYSSGIRLFPQFKSKNDPQEEFPTERFIPDESIMSKCKFAVKINEIYPKDSKNEYQFEEILFAKWKKGERKLKFCGDETIMVEEDMEETRCAWGNFDPHSRRSFFPSRKSLLYPGGGSSSRKSIAPPRISMAPSAPSINIEEEKNESMKVPPKPYVQTTIPSTPSLDIQNTSVVQLRRSVIIENPLNVTRENVEKNENNVPPSVGEKFKIYDDEEEQNDLVSRISSMMSTKPQVINENSSNSHTEENSTASNKIPESVPDVVTEEAKSLEKFEIYEDQTEENFQFKIPKSIMPPAVRMLKDQDVENIPITSLPVPFETQFEPNETCSTQTFSLFIKPQSVSTPITNKSQSHHLRNAAAATATSNAAVSAENNFQKQISSIEKKDIVKSPPEEHEISPTSQTEVSPGGDQPLSMQPRQLSTILETSEPITASSASGGSGGVTTVNCSAKLLDYHQISSPESENEVLNAHHHQISSKISTPIAATPRTTMRSAPPPLQTIPEIVQQQPPIQVNSKNEISRFQNKEETIPSLMMSMKVFEDKTDTIPKMMLIPTTKVSTKPIMTPTPSKAANKSDFFNMLLKTPKRTPIKPNLVVLDESLSKLADFSMSKLREEQDKKNSQGVLSIPNFSLKKIINSIEDDLNSSVVPGFEDFMAPSNKNALQIPSATNKKATNLLIDSKIPFFEDCLVEKFEFPKKSTITGNLMEKSIGLDISEPFKKPFQTSNEKSSAMKFDNPAPRNLDKSSTHLQSNDKFVLPAVSDAPSVKKSIVKPRISIFDRLRENNNENQNEEQEVFEDNVRTEAFAPNATGIRNSTLLPKSVQESNEKSFNIKGDAMNISGSSVIIAKEQSFKEQSISSKTATPITQNVMKKSSLTLEKSARIENKTEPHGIHQEFIQEKSICLIDQMSFTGDYNEKNGATAKLPKKSILSKFSEISRRKSNMVNEPTNEMMNTLRTPSSMNLESQPLDSIKKSQQHKISSNATETSNRNDENEYSDVIINESELSIYKDFNFKTPIVNHHAWKEDGSNNDDDDNSFQVLQKCENNQFIEPQVDLNETRQVIGDCFTGKHINPFKKELLDAFLNNIEFYDYLKKLPSCMLLNKVPCLKKRDIIKVHDKSFEVQKMIGEGAYGTIFCAKDKTTGKLYALKQEKPANLWEYYICLELQSRIRNQDFLSAFLNIEYAVIGNNAGILISNYSKYGSLITVCNKVRKISNRTIDESVVMVLASQMLSVIDHLHSCNIIHADIKADNFLLMSKLIYGDKRPVIQLIDFGCSIDMEQFPDDQKFNYQFNTDDFRCIEMRENRPWTFQIDLYGLAGIFHALLFGKYMEVEKKITGWVQKAVIPRYYKRSLWQMIFNTLLNIPNCTTMPNLQELKTALEEEIEENEKFVRDKILQFNVYIES